MRIVSLKECFSSDVQKWFFDNIPNITDYQKEKMREDEMIRFAPFYFMEKGKKVDNILVRFSIIFMLPVLILLIVGLPFNFFITGRWGWEYKFVRWFGKWMRACGM